MMEHAPYIGAANQFAADMEVRHKQPLSKILAPHRLPVALAIVTACVCFVADLSVPRGVTPAILYAVVPVLAGSSKKRGVIFALTLTCTVLTWIGYVLEPSGAAWWTSAFERVMVTVVLWVSLALVLRRLILIGTLAERTRAMERATDELARSNEELDRFASVVAHDLRGPLNSIGLEVQLLAAILRPSLDPKSTESIFGVQRQIQNMSGLMQRLLVYGRVGGGELRLVSCDCESILSGVLRSASLQNSDLAASHDPLPVVRGDPLLIAELFQNLIENAVKYRGKDAPRVHISAVSQKTEWVFAVSDNGIGIREANREKIFQPFTQVDRTARAAGVGLGLATCKRIIKRHGGRIWVESIVGEGSTFYFTMEPSATVTATDSPQAARLPSGK